MSIDMSSIMGKVKESGKKSSAAKAAKKSNGYTVTDDEARRVVRDLISDLQKEAASCGLPESLMKHFDNLYISRVYMDNNGFNLEISFGGDLSRPSLFPSKYKDGVDNIVALFNNGYNARRQVFGYWVSHDLMIFSRSHYDGDRFMQKAIRNFTIKYSMKNYDMEVYLSDKYTRF